MVLIACIVAAFALDLIIDRISARLGRNSRDAAWLLFAATTVAYAVLVNTMIGVANFTGDANIARFFILGFSVAVVIVGCFILGVLALAVAVGFEGRRNRLTRAAVVVLLVAIPASAVGTFGLVAACFFGGYVAFLVDDTVEGMLRRPDAPAPAVAAGLLAGTLSMILVVVYLIARAIIKAVFAVIRFIAEMFG